MTQHIFPFQFVANDLALDFVNTRIRAGTQIHDLIATPARLSLWLQEVGLDCPLDNWTDKDFKELYELRDVLTHTSWAAIEGSEVDRDAIRLINNHLLNHRSDLNLSKNEHGFHVTKRDVPLSSTDLLGLLAYITAQMLSSTDSKRLKNCAHADCILVFKDISKSGRRRWCSMETCGNRSKVAAFRAGGNG